MNQVIELAERLGKAIAESPPAAKVRAARKELEAQPELTQLLNDYAAQSDKIDRLAREQKPVEVDDKHKLRELHEKLVASGLFKRLQAAQVDYADLMRQVNEAINRHVREVGGE